MGGGPRRGLPQYLVAGTKNRCWTAEPKTMLQEEFSTRVLFSAVVSFWGAVYSSLSQLRATCVSTEAVGTVNLVFELDPLAFAIFR